jgi:type II secretory pathway pseudopilin PulG
MHRAFTLAELLIVGGIMAMMLTLGIGNLLGSQRKSQMTTTVNTLVSDIRDQRIKAMTGDTEGTGVVSSYGIYFETDEYTVFRGGSYTEGAPGNFEVKLDPTLTFSTTSFPGNIMVFAAGSGEIVGWTGTENTVTLTEPDSGATKIISLNKYGVPIAIN